MWLITMPKGHKKARNVFKWYRTVSMLGTPHPHISFTTLGSRSAKHTRQSAGLSAPAQSLRAWNPISGADLKPTGIPREASLRWEVRWPAGL